MAAEATTGEPRPRCNRRRLVRVTLLALLLVCGALLVGMKYRQALPSIAVQSSAALDHSLLSAIRNGNHEAVTGLLDEGANVNTRNQVGDTALMQAAVNSDLAMMQLLLEHGADVHARGVYDMTPLLRAVHDPERANLLLERRAGIDARAMVLAAMVPGSRKTLELLWRGGGDVNAAVGGYTPLMASAYAGDLDAATWLVQHGAHVNAKGDAGCTALNGAAVAGSSGIVKLLLDRGADPNVRYQEPESSGDFQTPLMNAAWHAHVDCVKLLLQHGADVNVHGGPFGRSPLLCAATTGSEETVRLLLAAGADARAVDRHGDTAVDWALKRGDTHITRLFHGGSTQSVRVPAAEQDRPRLHQQIDSHSISKAVAASLPPLQRSGRRITQTRKCITCHQHSLVAMTVGLARKRGFPVDEETAGDERGQVQEKLRRKIPALLIGAGLDPPLAAYTLAGFAAEDRPPDLLTDALVHYLVLHQHQDGCWPTEAYRPPEDGRPFPFTALAARALQVYAPGGRRAEIADRLLRARNWLLAAQPPETSDSAFQLLGLKWTGAQAENIATSARRLMRQQRADGGWSQLPTLPSDAYATGLVLYALQEAGTLSPGAGVLRHGIAFLLRTQLADGTWYVPTRCFPALEYSSSGFPHGRSQFISAAATCWATMALFRACPERGQTPYPARCIFPRLLEKQGSDPFPDSPLQAGFLDRDLMGQAAPR